VYDISQQRAQLFGGSCQFPMFANGFQQDPKVCFEETISHNLYGDGSKPWYLVNPKIAGKWMFIPLKMYL
jgi:hypothetical protein